ncbi:eukaryotic translation initiation factor 4E-like isoform X2 [Stegodyphus dumicola]|uniref:eukaryotic translation initiation factor 4E-like isoform X2 n=1 Tax=Stegodyphus dumicola TaxID=202533 RepID=UPI0015ACE0C4|nr:eukaryotic translation initiation factor 4E-like isoform X2 [Stegodyphus dumicola]
MSAEEQEQNEQNASTPVEEIPPELMVKHPLQHMWSLWFYKNDRTKSWEENLMEITTFDTVEDFWALYNHIEVVSKLPMGCDYALFKLLCMIGEAFEEYSDDICGAVVQIRNKGDKLGLWTADVKHHDAIMKIGRTIKERLNLHPRNAIGYEAHSDTQIKTGSAAKCRYTL